MTFKPTELYKELYEPNKYNASFDQQNVHETPINIVTDTLYLEAVDYVYFQYDAEVEDDDVAIDWCEISITFAAGGEMFIKTTDYKTLKAFGFDYTAALESAQEHEEGDTKSEHCTKWGLK